MARHHKIRELLSPDDLAALQQFVREKNDTRTTDECMTWVEAKGYVVGRTAVWNWLDTFRMEESTRRASEVSAAYLTAAAGGDSTKIASATLQRLQEMVFDFLVTNEKADAGELLKIAMAIKTGLGSQQAILDLRQKQADALKAGEALAKEGGTGEAVVSKVRQILGIA